MQGRAGGSKKRSSPVETTITAAIIKGALSMRMIVMVTATPALFRSRLRRENCALYCVVSMSCRYVHFLVARLQPDSTAKYTPALHDGRQYLDFRSLNAPDLIQFWNKSPRPDMSAKGHRLENPMEVSLAWHISRSSTY
jgi:hypothetical protein